MSHRSAARPAVDTQTRRGGGPAWTVPADGGAAAQSAGWYPDPVGESELRYWTGTEWTFRIARRRSARAVVHAAIGRVRRSLAGWRRPPFGR